MVHSGKELQLDDLCQKCWQSLEIPRKQQTGPIHPSHQAQFRAQRDPVLRLNLQDYQNRHLKEPALFHRRSDAAENYLEESSPPSSVDQLCRLLDHFQAEARRMYLQLSIQLDGFANEADRFTSRKLGAKRRRTEATNGELPQRSRKKPGCEPGPER